MGTKARCRSNEQSEPRRYAEPREVTLAIRNAGGKCVIALSDGESVARCRIRRELTKPETLQLKTRLRKRVSTLDGVWEVDNFLAEIGYREMRSIASERWDGTNQPLVA